MARCIYGLKIQLSIYKYEANCAASIIYVTLNQCYISFPLVLNYQSFTKAVAKIQKMSNRAYLADERARIIHKHVARNCKYIYICASIGTWGARYSDRPRNLCLPIAWKSRITLVRPLITDKIVAVVNGILVSAANKAAINNSTRDVCLFGLETLNVTR